MTLTCRGFEFGALIRNRASAALDMRADSDSAKARTADGVWCCVVISGIARRSFPKFEILSRRCRMG